MMMSNTEYMSDPARVERVVQKVLNLKLKDISEAGGKKQIDFVLEPVIKNEVLVSSMAMNMSFLEFACMVENIGESPDYDFNDHDRYSEQQFAYLCMGIALRNCSSKLVPVRLFLALPIKAYYEYLQRCSGKSCLLPEYFSLVEYKGLKEDVTIGEFLQKKIDATRDYWLPVSSLKKYEREIREAYKDIGRLLVDSLSTAFESSFDVRAICKRCGAYDQQMESIMQADAESDQLLVTQSD